MTRTIHKGALKMRDTFHALVALLLVSTPGLAVTYEWDAENPQPIAGGDVEVAVEDGKVASIAVNTSANEDIVFSGDAMAFADDAQISLAVEGTGRLVFNAPVSSAGTISLTNLNSRIMSYDGAFLPATGSGTQIVAENVSIADVMFLPVVFDLPAISGTALPYFVTRSGSTMTAQFQLHESGSSYVKCVKVLLEQSGDNLAASILYARYTPGDTPGAVDFEELPVVTTTPQVGEAANRAIATTSDQISAYGLCKMALRMANDAAVAVRFTEPVTGALSISTNVSVSVSGNAVAAWQSEIRGQGGLLLFEGGALGEAPVQYGRDSSAMPTKTATLLAANQSLRNLDIASLSAQLTGSGLVGNGSLKQAYVCYATNDGLRASAWCQYMDYADNDASRGTVKGVKLAFSQVQKDVYVRIETARSLSQNAGRTYRYGVDLENHPDSKEQTNIAGTPTSAGYGVGEFTVSFDLAVPAVTVDLLAGCTFTNGTIGATGGVALVASDADSVPPYGTVSVGDGADLVVTYNAPSTSGGVGNGTTYLDVKPGGRLRVPCVQAFRYDQKIACDGGLIELGLGGTNPTAWISTYIQNIALSGSRIVSSGLPRIGRANENPVITVRGDTPSFIDSALQLLGSSNLTKPVMLNFDVADVTSSDAVDFAVRGGIVDWNSASQSPVTIQKTGNGTMALVGANTFGTSISGTIKISEGVLLLAENGVTHAAQYCRFDGGTLTASAGSTNVIGTITTVSAASRIVLEEGASLTFRAVDSAAWTSGATLIIEGNPGKTSTLRIGTTASDLTPSQKAAVKCRVPGSDKLLRVKLDENGYASPLVLGLIMSFR